MIPLIHNVRCGTESVIPEANFACLDLQPTLNANCFYGGVIGGLSLYHAKENQKVKNCSDVNRNRKIIMLTVQKSPGS